MKNAILNWLGFGIAEIKELPVQLERLENKLDKLSAYQDDLESLDGRMDDAECYIEDLRDKDFDDLDYRLDSLEERVGKLLEGVKVDLICKIKGVDND